jgi:hypothetical protein
VKESAASTPARTRHRKSALTADAILAGLLWWFAPWHTPSPVTVTGSAYTNAEAMTIGFTANSRYVAARRELAHEGGGLVVVGVPWTDQGSDQGGYKVALPRITPVTLPW